jgi:hypothetical protein
VTNSLVFVFEMERTSALIFHQMKQRTLRLAAAGAALLGLVCIAIFAFQGGGAGKLSWDPAIVRKSLMTFAYKIYADPAAENGRYFLSKIVFHNDGNGPVRDLSVSYQIPDYIPWTTPETHPEIPPGDTVVQLYYPQLPAKVTQLTSSTTATLETRIRWSDRPGKTKEEILRSNVLLRGVNEIEYTDLPANELLTWYDMFATAPFATAMVTPNDPVVKEFVAEVTKRTGGTMAGIAGGAQEIARMMKAIYDYMCDTGMRYTSDAGVPTRIGDVQTTVQNVRLPRDVIISNEGLCIELAILWASVMEHLGCNATIVFVPGHAFTVVRYGQGSGDIIPVECTAITPMAVGARKPVPFEDAVKMAAEELEKQRYQIWVNVEQYQKQGFRAPELPNIEIDKIKGILSARSSHTATGYARNSGAGNGAVRPGYFRWTGANNLVSVDVPEHWTRMENSPIPGMIFAAQDTQTSVAVNVFYYPNLSSVAEAMQTARQGVARVNGGRVRITSQQQKGNSIVYTGTTSYRNGGTQWVGIFGPSPSGVIGFFVGANKGHFQQNQPIISDIINSARLETTGTGEGN